MMIGSTRNLRVLAYPGAGRSTQGLQWVVGIGVAGPRQGSTQW